jgi:hypothetical protein
MPLSARRCTQCYFDIVVRHSKRLATLTSLNRKAEHSTHPPMLLRNHPLMRYRGVPSWPPEWVWTDGLEDKRPNGEIGIFRRIVQSSIQPSNRCFLFIDYEESNYIGCLTVDDHGFCAQIVRFLQAHCYNRPIAEIGGLDLSHTL